MTKKRFFLLSFSACLLSLAACDDKDSPILVTAVELNKGALVLVEGGDETLFATVTPGNATDKTVKWDSTNEAVATVDANGNVTAVARSEATITATAKDGSGKSDECVVTVNSASIPVSSVKFGQNTKTMAEGGKETMSVSISPANATNKALSWNSTNKTVATVDENGKVTALARGETTITVTAGDGSGKSDQCVLSVIENTMGVASFKTPTTWTVGGKTWSDAVMATRCRKETYNGGTYSGGVYKIDCRSNDFPGDDYNPAHVYGDFFSWEAVNTHKSILCPEPWRTPTAQDFVALDIALGGDGINREMLSGRINRYVSEWGGEFGGYCWYYNDAMVFQDVTQYACYWSGEQVNRTDGAALLFGTPRGYITPAGQSEKTNGYTLRCVK